MKIERLSNGLEYYRTMEYDGYIVMTNAKTIKRYEELYNEAIKNVNNGDIHAFEKMKQAAAKECDPQEVYFYEFNNYECMYSDDEQAIRIIIDIFGVEVAKTIHRVDAGHSIDYILTPGWVKHTWRMLGRLMMDCDYYLGYGNRCASNLWAHDEKAHLAEMRRLLATLPDEYKPVRCTNEIINEYEKRMLG